MGRFTAVLILALTASAHAEPGFTAGVGGGTNVDAPYVVAQLGRRFERVPFLEVFLDYSYDRPISELSFQTFGAGVRTYVARWDRVELFHQATAAFAVSASGKGPVQNRDLGERLLGAFMEQGLGVAVHIDCRWSASLAVSTGYPVWLRPELAVRVVF